MKTTVERNNDFLYFFSESTKVKVGQYFGFYKDVNKILKCVSIEKCDSHYSHDTVIDEDGNRYYEPQCYRLVCTTDTSIDLPRPTEEFMKDWKDRKKAYMIGDEFDIIFKGKKVQSMEKVCYCACCQRHKNKIKK